MVDHLVLLIIEARYQVEVLVLHTTEVQAVQIQEVFILLAEVLPEVA